jgi:hypothetical protein
MAKRKVAVVYSHPLFGEGLARLLNNDEELTVSCIRANTSGVAREIVDLRPEAIIVEDDADEAFIRGILNSLPPVLVIRVGLQDNAMEVYHCRHVIPGCPGDLLDVIRSGTTHSD